MEKRIYNSGNVIKIAVTGPESTGKSTLASELATHYHTDWVPEYARDYLNKIDHPYTFDDVEKIAAGQIAREDKLASNPNKYLFCDTELIVIKIWMEYKYHKVPGWILQEIKSRQYDILFLCDIDIPWEPDPLRENPDLRRFFLDWFIKELTLYKKRFVIISGDQKLRIGNAVKIINTLFPEIS
jgi:NadR type nicotinamide-nucleotide adenylyltransferase